MPRRVSSPSRLPVPVGLIERRIYLIRDQKVMLDSDLAELYQVETFNLNKAVKRNLDRFPEDFMFQLKPEEARCLRFQIGMSKNGGRGGRRTPPYAFTELGVAMLSSVLNSDRAVRINILIMRAFVKLREALASHKGLAEEIDKLKATQREHAVVLIGVIRDIKKLQAPRKRNVRIGFYPAAR